MLAGIYFCDLKTVAEFAKCPGNHFQIVNEFTLNIVVNAF